MPVVVVVVAVVVVVDLVPVMVIVFVVGQSDTGMIVQDTRDDGQGEIGDVVLLGETERCGSSPDRGA